MRKPKLTPPSVDAPQPTIGACAICGRPRDARYNPFCSKRCADVDLYRWLKGRYVIPGALAPRADDEED